MKAASVFLEKIKRTGSRLAVQEELSAKRSKSRWFIVGSPVIAMLYTIAVFIFPYSENLLYILACIVLMAAASWADIKEKQIPVVVLGSIFIINIFHSVFFIGNYSSWVVAAVFSALLLGVHLIKKDAIGTGDIMLLGLGISSLAAENILLFLFLSFILSSIVGIVLLAVKKNLKAIAVPMAPCITLAWIAGLVLFS
ncbi:MAG: prepilin peptidase [Thermoclostridium sp.]|nr:prepilin peptidase [Thermoclostridium sp.]